MSVTAQESFVFSRTAGRGDGVRSTIFSSPALPAVSEIGNC